MLVCWLDEDDDEQLGLSMMKMMVVILWYSTSLVMLV